MAKQHDSGSGTGLRQAFEQFLAIPTFILAGALALAIVTLVLDRVRPDFLEPFHDFLSQHLLSAPTSVATLLSTVATTIVTVTSITFSVLLLALQQSAASLSAQVFDQFLRRQRNQIFFGFFLGLGLYALFTLASVQPDFTPTYGALVTLIMVAIALGLIPFVIYATIDEMRPGAIVGAIRDHTIRARDSQRDLLARTRRKPRRQGPGREIEADRTGFVTSIDVDRLAGLLRNGEADAELQLEVRLGNFVGYHDRLGVLRGGTEDVSLDEVRDSIGLADQREMTCDPNYGLAQLEAIGWTSATSSKQNPQPAMLVVHYVSDLIARWIEQREEDRQAEEGDRQAEEGRPQAEDRAPVVYQDDLLHDALGTLNSLAVAASEGMQHQTVAAIYSALARLFPRLPADLREDAEQAILRSLSALADHVLTLQLAQSVALLRDTLEDAGATAAGRHVRDALARMEPSASRLSARGMRPNEA